jgi:hypothetical protein
MTENDPRWEQPSFTAPTYEQPVSGPVLGASGPGPVGLVVTVAPRSAEVEQLRAARRLIWPIALVLAIVTGHVGPIIVLAIAVGVILRARQHELVRRSLLARPVVAPVNDLR